MRTHFRSASPELYLAGGIAVSLVLAAVMSRFPALAFAGFIAMAGVLVTADVVLYLLMKIGAIKAPSNRAS